MYFSRNAEPLKTITLICTFDALRRYFFKSLNASISSPSAAHTRKEFCITFVVGNRHYLAIRLLTRKTQGVYKDLFTGNTWEDKNIFNFPVWSTGLIPMSHILKPQHS